MLPRSSAKWLLLCLAMMSGLLLLSFLAFSRAEAACTAAKDRAPKVVPVNETILESASHAFVMTLLP